MQYSYGKSAWKAVKVVGFFCAGAIATAVASPDFLEIIQGHASLIALTPAIQALAVFSLDWLKHNR